MKNLLMINWRHTCDKLKRNPDLVYLTWESTLTCNFKCKHCRSPKESGDINQELSTQEVKDIFLQISKDFSTSKINICLTGGEPLLREDFHDTTSYINKLGFVWSFVSNGFFIDDEVIRKAKSSNISNIVLSLDGTRDFHDWFRGVRGAFDKVINAIKISQQNRINYLQITTCVMPSNIESLETIYNLLSDLNVKNWSVMPVYPIGRAQNKDFGLNKNQFVKLLDFVKEKRKDRKMDVVFGDEGFLGKKYEKEVRPYFYTCHAGLKTAAILYNGDVIGCGSLPRNDILVQGNLRKDTLSFIWNRRFQLYRDDNWKKTENCKKCKEWYFCRGNSLHLWDFKANKPAICHYKEYELWK